MPNLTSWQRLSLLAEETVGHQKGLQKLINAAPGEYKLTPHKYNTETLARGTYFQDKVFGALQKNMIKKARIKDDLNYAWYVTKHKANIVPPMLQMKLPLTQALAHDLSKYRPSEFKAYRDWFNGPKGLRGTRDPELYKQWRNAVSLHYSRNMHHWRKRGLLPEQVPLKYRMESVADWYSVGKTNRRKGTKFPAFRDWYTAREAALPVDPEAKLEISNRLGLAKSAYLMEKIAWAVKEIS